MEFKLTYAYRNISMHDNTDINTPGAKKATCNGSRCVGDRPMTRPYTICLPSSQDNKG